MIKVETKTTLSYYSNFDDALAQFNRSKYAIMYENGTIIRVKGVLPASLIIDALNNAIKNIEQGKYQEAKAILEEEIDCINNSQELAHR